MNNLLNDTYNLSFYSYLFVTDPLFVAAIPTDTVHQRERKREEFREALHQVQLNMRTLSAELGNYADSLTDFLSNQSAFNMHF